MMSKIWTPQPKQAIFMSRPEYEGLYGGAAGGGKSDALVIEALRQVHIPHYKGLILRKTFPQLAEIIDKSFKYYKQAFPKARYNESRHTWIFPSGAKIIFGSMQHLTDRTKYQGQAYDFIAFDELTHFVYEEYSYMYSRNRPNGPGTRVYIRATANPGGIGQIWVKERFITPAAPMTPISESHKIIYPDGHEETVVLKRIFVPSSVFDNKALMQNDPMYVQRLASMPEAEKNALLYGDWNSFSGMVFSEWRDDCEHYADRRGTHVINPFIIPKEWTVWRAMDWGFSRPFSVGWYAVDYDKRLYRIAEYYGCTGEPNVGVKENPDVVARKIREIENTNINLKGRKIYGVADPAIFNDSGTESISTLMEREGVWFERGDNERLAGKMQIHYRLRFDDGV
ncbi:MAG: terminase family protein, partial [Oscillospiraceae bacterium]|nr:terminase family protein [Oscillospiraceae bacterium]